MILIDAAGLKASRPNRPLFDDVSLTLSDGDRVGVVGINGCGKSTLLRFLGREATPEAGEVRWGRGARVGFLTQQPELPPGTVRDAVGGGWEGEAMLDRLGMAALVDSRTDELSGGQAKRVALARLLCGEYEALILDEPTNHLDLDAIKFLEEWLAAYRGGLVLVTHDRHVLDRAAPNHPVWIQAWGPTTPNICVFNSTALRELGINRETPSRQSNVWIEKDSAGDPTGRLSGPVNTYYTGDPYMDELLGRLPLLDPGIAVPATLEGVATYHRMGVTTIITGNCGNSRTDLAAFFKETEGVDITKSDKFIYPDSFFWHEAAGIYIFFGAGEVDFHVGGVHVAADDDRFLFAEFFGDLDEVIVEFHFEGETFWTATTIWEVDIE